MKFVCIDFFCGGGGATHGFQEAGFEIALAIDCWEEALTIHRLNHPNVETLCFGLGGDFDKLKAIIDSRLIKYKNKEIHLHFHGSPPCQELSNASNIEAIEGMKMVMWFIDFVKFYGVDSWSMENVVPVEKYLPKSIDCVKLNSADFGVPQRRERIFAGFGFNPVKTHRRSQWVSMKEALPQIEGELVVCKSMVERWFPIGLNHTFPTMTSKVKSQIRIVSRRTKGEKKDQIYTIDQPTHTITQLPHVIEIEEKTERSLTLEEAAVIQGWPDMKLGHEVKKGDLWKIVGNMVCPPVAFAVGLSIIKSKKEGIKFTTQKKLF